MFIQFNTQIFIQFNTQIFIQFNAQISIQFNAQIFIQFTTQIFIQFFAQFRGLYPASRVSGYVAIASYPAISRHYMVQISDSHVAFNYIQIQNYILTKQYF